MSTMSDLLGKEAAPTVFEHGGKTYHVSPLTLERQSAIEKWLKAQAYSDLYGLREHLPPDQYADALASLQANRAAYAYLGDIFWRTLGSVEGSTMMVCVLLGVPRSEGEKLIAERGPDLAAVVEEMVISSMPRAQAELVRSRLLARRAPAGSEPANPPAPA